MNQAAVGVKGRQIPIAIERRSPRRYPAGLGHPATCEVDYSAQELQFMLAIDRYKRELRRPFPSSEELLQIVESLGYRRVESNRLGDLLASAGADKVRNGSGD